MKSIPVIAILMIGVVIMFSVYQFSPKREVKIIEKVVEVVKVVEVEKVVEVKEVEKIVEVEKADETWKEIKELTKFEKALIIMGTILLFGLILGLLLYADYKL